MCQAKELCLSEGKEFCRYGALGKRLTKKKRPRILLWMDPSILCRSEFFLFFYGTLFFILFGRPREPQKNRPRPGSWPPAGPPPPGWGPSLFSKFQVHALLCGCIIAAVPGSLLLLGCCWPQAKNPASCSTAFVAGRAPDFFICIFCYGLFCGTGGCV